MDAVVQNTLTKKDKVLVINGGSFGNRFKEICDFYEIPNEEYRIEHRKQFDKNEFEKYSKKGFSALLVNICETSTGQKYDMDYLGDFCCRNDMILIADAVSAYLADPIFMEKQNIDVLFTSSQKALALAPGVALVAISKKAYETRIKNQKMTYYFDFNNYIAKQTRGQTPFTPPVNTVIAIYDRLNTIMLNTIEKEWEIHKNRAQYFRNNIIDLPIATPDFTASNCLTSLIFENGGASNVYESLKSKYGVYLTPSGGNLKDVQLRVGHLGNLCQNDYDMLIKLLRRELSLK